MEVLRKVKALITGERQDLQTGEVIGRLPGHYEVVDPTPMAPPIGYKREPTLMEKIQLMVMKEKIQRLQEHLGAETPAEAEDFDIGEDDGHDPSSPYEFERHEMELLERMEKMQRRHAELTAKYPGHNFGPMPFEAELAGEGRSPSEGAPAPVPAAGTAAPAAAEPPPGSPPVAK